MAYVDVDKLAIDDYRIDLSQYVKKSDLINTAHPVGDTMIRLDNINPGTLPGYEGTVWQKISEGKMLIGANSQFPLGSTGGNAQHKHSVGTINFTGRVGGTTLSAAQSGLPSHNHGQNAHNHSAGSYSDGTAAQYLKVKKNTDIIVDTSKRALGAAASNGKYIIFSNQSGTTHGITEYENTEWATAQNQAAGGWNASQSHDHPMNHTHPAQDTTNASSMPPYLAVNIWTRIS